MAETFKGLIFAFVLFTLFGLLLLTTVLQLGSTYEKGTDDVVGGALNITKYNNSLNSINDSISGIKTKWVTGDIFGLAGVVVTGIFDIANGMIEIFIVTPFNLLQGIMLNIFHIPPIVTIIIYVLIILAIIFALWQLIKFPTGM